VKEGPHPKNSCMPIPINPGFILKQSRLLEEFKDRNDIKANTVLAIVWRID